MIRLLWAVHNHQPVGNFDWVFERAFNHAYRPFLEVLAVHPSISLSMHFSGILLSWLKENKPEYVEKLGSLVQVGQVELLGGGFYEPILPVISDFHKSGQLDKLQREIRETFGVSPKGIWLAERVWEPSLIKPIADAGIEYVVLDGSHFKMAGKNEADLNGYFLSEDQGATLKLFPISDTVRDYIPFRPVSEVLAELRALNTEDYVQVVFGDDGEKFGDWPGTYDLVYAQQWLHTFFSAIENHPSEFRIEKMESGLLPEKNKGLVYLPAASYQEMMIWAQDARDIPAFRKAKRLLELESSEENPAQLAKFVKGSIWRNFLIKYPESNQMHKQGIRLSAMLERLAGDMPTSRYEMALDHIRQAQCNCGYWHGVFGGLYLPHLRFALYRNLIDSQKLVDEVLFRGGKKVLWDTADWNCDGKPEYTLNTPELYLSFTSLGEINQYWLKKTRMNLTDTLTRRFEAYHDSIEGVGDGGTKLENQLGHKEANLKNLLIYDKRIRHSSTDRYLPSATSFPEYERMRFEEALTFSATGVQTMDDEEGAVIIFSGTVSEKDGHSSLQVRKRFRIPSGGSGLRVDWQFEALGKDVVRIRFISENLFCLLAGKAEDRYVEWRQKESLAALGSKDFLASRGEILGCTGFRVRDEWLRLDCRLEFDGPRLVWRDALETVSQSEGGYERVYQGTVVAPVWDISLKPGLNLELGMSLEVKEGE